MSLWIIDSPKAVVQWKVSVSLAGSDGAHISLDVQHLCSVMYILLSWYVLLSLFVVFFLQLRKLKKSLTGHIICCVLWDKMYDHKLSAYPDMYFWCASLKWIYKKGNYILMLRTGVIDNRGRWVGSVLCPLIFSLPFVFVFVFGPAGCAWQCLLSGLPNL